jgi:hypothetical protein
MPMAKVTAAMRFELFALHRDRKGIVIDVFTVLNPQRLVFPVQHDIATIRLPLDAVGQMNRKKSLSSTPTSRALWLCRKPIGEISFRSAAGKSTGRGISSFMRGCGFPESRITAWT